MTGNDRGEVVEKLFDAVSHDDLEKVKTIVESGGVSLVTINRSCDDTEETLAHVAARRGNLEMLMYLLEKDSSLIEKKEDGPRSIHDRLTLLETAVKYGHLHVVKYLVESHNDDIFRALFIYPSYLSPVTLAILESHLDIVKYFIEERRVDPNTGGPQKTERLYHNSRSLLFPAIMWKQNNITMYLIDEVKANLTVLCYEDNQNILYGAQHHDDLNLIKYILDVKKAPIDINWRDSEGKTLLYSAVEKGHLDILQYLVEQKKADVNMPSYDRKRTAPLHLAIYRRPEIFEYLVDHGAHIDARNNHGDTPLHLVAASRIKRKVRYYKYLLERGANAKLKNYRGESPLELKTDMTKRRRRRSVIDQASIWIPHHQPNPENYAPQVVGDSCEETIPSKNEWNTLNLYGLLVLSNFAVRYFYHSPVRVPQIAGILPKSANHVAEDAINTFVDLEVDETS